jgi:hypothetical protein
LANFEIDIAAGIPQDLRKARLDASNSGLSDLLYGLPFETDERAKDLF